jgi:hypothetical protein
MSDVSWPPGLISRRCEATHIQSINRQILQKGVLEGDIRLRCPIQAWWYGGCDAERSFGSVSSDRVANSVPFQSASFQLTPQIAPANSRETLDVWSRVDVPFDNGQPNMISTAIRDLETGINRAKVGTYGTR